MLPVCVVVSVLDALGLWVSDDEPERLGVGDSEGVPDALAL